MEEMEQIKQATILAVDDDEFNLKLLRHLLAAEGHAVRTAASGEDALCSVAEQLPDLVLLDVMMPGMSGFEVLRQLKADARTRSIPISWSRHWRIKNRASRRWRRGRRNSSPSR